MNIKLIKNKTDIDNTNYYIYKNEKFNLLLKTDIEKKCLAELSFLDYNKDVESVSKEPDVIKQTIKELDEYFKNKRKVFTIPLSIFVREFQYNVLKKTADIGFGEISTYGTIAKEIGKTGGFFSRAVGRAEATNPIAIIIPCHRVLSYNHSLNGYAFGLDTKQYLLELEGHKIIEQKLI